MPDEDHARRRPRAGLWVTLAIVAGVLCMTVPALIRDGVCGVFSCVDQVPDIAVGVAADGSVTVLVPTGDAGSVQAVQLLQSGPNGASSPRWRIEADTEEPDVDEFAVGAPVEGFTTVRPLEQPPIQGGYTAEVVFRCTISSVPFAPADLDQDRFTTTSGDVVTEATFRSNQQSGEQCASEPSGVERALFFVGIVLTAVGAMVGLFLVLRRPDPRIDEPWSDSDDGDDWQA